MPSKSNENGSNLIKYLNPFARNVHAYAPNVRDSAVAATAIHCHYRKYLGKESYLLKGKRNKRHDYYCWNCCSCLFDSLYLVVFLSFRCPFVTTPAPAAAASTVQSVATVPFLYHNRLKLWLLVSTVMAYFIFSLHSWTDCES